MPHRFEVEHHDIPAVRALVGAVPGTEFIAELPHGKAVIQVADKADEDKFRQALAPSMPRDRDDGN